MFRGLAVAVIIVLSPLSLVLAESLACPDGYRRAANFPRTISSDGPTPAQATARLQDETFENWHARCQEESGSLDNPFASDFSAGTIEVKAVRDEYRAARPILCCLADAE